MPKRANNRRLKLSRRCESSAVLLLFSNKFAASIHRHGSKKQLSVLKGSGRRTARSREHHAEALRATPCEGRHEDP